MKKRQKGFTMAEILITLAIIGVVAAIALPAVTSLMPDKNKIMYLKAYDSLVSTIKSLAYNKSIFPPVINTGSSNIRDISKATLANYSNVTIGDIDIEVTISDSNNVTNDKLCKVLANTFNILGSESCSQTEFPDSPSFTTQNGMKWWITTPMARISGRSYSDGKRSTVVEYYSFVYVDVDPAMNSTNCFVTDAACEGRVPDRFKFIVLAGGEVYPADSFGKEYLKNRMSTKKVKIDIANPVEDDITQGLITTEVYTYIPEEEDSE